MSANLTQDVYSAAEVMLKNYFNLFVPEDISNISVKEFLSAQFNEYKMTSMVNRIDIFDDRVELFFFKVGAPPADHDSLLYDSRYQLAVFAARQHRIYKNKSIVLKFLFLETGVCFEFKIDREKSLAFERKFKELIYNISMLEAGNGGVEKIIEIPDTYIFRGHKITAENVKSPIFLARLSGWCNYCEMFSKCEAWKKKPNERACESQSDYNKRIRMSYSKYSGYLNCPYNWKKKYIDKTPSKPQPFFDLGHSVHETMEKFYNADDKKKRTLEYLLKIYDAIFPKFTSGYKNQEEYSRYYDNGKKMLEKYYANFVDADNFKPALHIEAYFELPLGKFTSINGYIDRIDKISDTECEILDYKTEPSNRTQEEIDGDKQLAIYSWAVENMYDCKVKQVSLFMLEFDEKKSSSFSKNMIDELLECIDKTSAEIIETTDKYKKALDESGLPQKNAGNNPDVERLTLNFFPPKKNKYCRSCEFLDICTLKNDILSDPELISMEK